MAQIAGTRIKLPQSPLRSCDRLLSVKRGRVRIARDCIARSSCGEFGLAGATDEFRAGAGWFAISVYRAVGASLAIGIMEVLASAAHEPLARVPFVTSIVLVTALPDSDPAQPRAVIFGHLISCLVGLAAQLVLGPGETTSAVAVGLATLAMIVTRTLHPPAGIDAFLLASHDLPAQWMLSPVLVGAVLLAGFARIWAMGERKWLATTHKRGVE